MNTEESNEITSIQSDVHFHCDKYSQKEELRNANSPDHSPAFDSPCAINEEQTNLQESGELFLINRDSILQRTFLYEETKQRYLNSEQRQNAKSKCKLFFSCPNNVHQLQRIMFPIIVMTIAFENVVRAFYYGKIHQFPSREGTIMTIMQQICGSLIFIALSWFTTQFSSRQVTTMVSFCVRALLIILLQPMDYYSLTLNYGRNLQFSMLFLVYLVIYNPYWWLLIFVAPLQILSNVLRESLQKQPNYTTEIGDDIAIPYQNIFTSNMTHSLLLVLIILQCKRFEMILNQTTHHSESSSKVAHSVASQTEDCPDLLERDTSNTSDSLSNLAQLLESLDGGVAILDDFFFDQESELQPQIHIVNCTLQDLFFKHCKSNLKDSINRQIFKIVDKKSEIEESLETTSLGSLLIQILDEQSSLLVQMVPEIVIDLQSQRKFSFLDEQTPSIFELSVKAIVVNNLRCWLVQLVDVTSRHQMLSKKEPSQVDLPKILRPLKTIIQKIVGVEQQIANILNTKSLVSVKAGKPELCEQQIQGQLRKFQTELASSWASCYQIQSHCTLSQQFDLTREVYIVLKFRKVPRDMTLQEFIEQQTLVFQGGIRDKNLMISTTIRVLHEDFKYTEWNVFEQALHQVLQNAVTASPINGQISIDVSTKQKFFTDQCDLSAIYFVVEVRDQGHQMTLDQQKAIFADNSSQKSLFRVKALLQAIGGSISIKPTAQSDGTVAIFELQASNYVIKHQLHVTGCERIILPKQNILGVLAQEHESDDVSSDNSDVFSFNSRFLYRNSARNLKQNDLNKKHKRKLEKGDRTGSSSINRSPISFAAASQSQQSRSSVSSLRRCKSNNEIIVQSPKTKAITRQSNAEKTLDPDSSLNILRNADSSVQRYQQQFSSVQAQSFHDKDRVNIQSNSDSINSLKEYVKDSHDGSRQVCELPLNTEHAFSDLSIEEEFKYGVLNKPHKVDDMLYRIKVDPLSSYTKVVTNKLQVDKGKAVFEPFEVPVPVFQKKSRSKDIESKNDMLRSVVEAKILKSNNSKLQYVNHLDRSESKISSPFLISDKSQRSDMRMRISLSSLPSISAKVQQKKEQEVSVQLLKFKQSKQVPNCKCCNILVIETDLGVMNIINKAVKNYVNTNGVDFAYDEQGTTVLLTSKLQAQCCKDCYDIIFCRMNSNGPKIAASILQTVKLWNQKLTLKGRPNIYTPIIVGLTEKTDNDLNLSSVYCVMQKPFTEHEVHLTLNELSK